jgi:hypothetical protein
MRLLSGNVDKRGHARALKMFAGGGVLLVVLWALAGPAPVEDVAVMPTVPLADAARPPSSTYAFVPRKAAGSVANLFSDHSWYVAPPAPPVVYRPPPPPSAPPLPFTVLGSYASTGGTPVYFLVKGDSVYDVRIGDVIENTYSVDSMSNGQLHFTYLPLKIDQSLPVGSAP